MDDHEKISTQSGTVLYVGKSLLDGAVEVSIGMAEPRHCILHWGLRNYVSPQWEVPPPSIWPQGTIEYGKGAVQSPFLDVDGRNEVRITIDGSVDLPLLNFVLFFPDERRWDNNKGRNYQIEILAPERQAAHDSTLGDASLVSVAEEIIEGETGRHSWTLMHRFNLCFDLLDRIRSEDLDGLALIFAWLRFSFIRQLDWQRNYNTKPRELGHALDRLTRKVADRYLRRKGERRLTRLIMSTLGPGGDAQRVRDEVLHIMHRHHIKEVSGHFMEEWHQKLHNNATADDIVICEAFIEFYRSNGDLGRFYSKLEEGGVTRERLENYERPIRSHPDFVPHLKDGLIWDLERFLGILREVHAGTDFGTALSRARNILDHETRGIADFIWHHRDDPQIPLPTLTERITEIRRRLAGMFREDTARDILFLDLSLEQLLRTVAERSLSSAGSMDQLIGLIALCIENVTLSGDNEELSLSLKEWRQLREGPDSDATWALRATAAFDRLRRAVASTTDALHSLMQPKAEFLGRAFRAAGWSVSLFGEEVVRGSTTFVLSMLLQKLGPLLRQRTGMGDWQVISGGSAVGKVTVVPSLGSVQGEHYRQAVTVIAEHVAGDEEIPRGVAAVITPATVDILSHLSIRARNGRILFATCHDVSVIEDLKSLRDHTLALTVLPNGSVHFEEAHEEPVSVKETMFSKAKASPRPVFKEFTIAMSEFDERLVGGKALHLKELNGKLPPWIRLPLSVAIPFGVFEKTLAYKTNITAARRYKDLIGRLDSEDHLATLGDLRSAIHGLEVPPELLKSLVAVMESAGFQPLGDAAEMWRCITRVWSSKWTERASLSRKANGIDHGYLHMAVLVQEVVPAEYAFVIHTVNPLNRAKDEVYAEVVPGLGETLAANHPGRALGFACRKGTADPRLFSFPSKSAGLFGGGLIFRSDSNGEDLAGFAGAGLYESHMLPAPRSEYLDYTKDRLTTDEHFRRELMVKIGEIGTVLEDVMGAPQDIEGAYSAGAYYVVQSRPQVGVDE
ncbi:MAG: phosphohistidine-like domain-containing protein [Chloroflexota bacterium]